MKPKVMDEMKVISVELSKTVELRGIKYFNNRVEQDLSHQAINQNSE